MALIAALLTTPILGAVSQLPKVKKFRGLLCKIFGHKWQYNKGKRRYVTCKRCGKLPKRQYETLCRLNQRSKIVGI